MLSAGPGGDTDPVGFINDHFHSGEYVTITRPTSVTSTERAHAIDPTHAHDAYVNAPLTQASGRLDVARTWVRRAEEARGVDDQAALSYVDKAVAAAREAYYLAMPARPADARGMWYRPVETSVEEIRRTLDRMRAAGMNELYLET